MQLNAAIQYRTQFFQSTAVNNNRAKRRLLEIEKSKRKIVFSVSVFHQSYKSERKTIPS